jgi:hypothetical protein
MKLWLDDIRNPRIFWDFHYDKGVIWVKTPEEAIAHLDTGRVTHLSLDNDLGLDNDPEGKPRDGYAVALWLEQRVAEDDTFRPPEVLEAHTANSAARPRMLAAFRKIRMLVQQRD